MADEMAKECKTCPPAGLFLAVICHIYISEMSHVKTRNLPYIGQICSQYAGGHEKGVMGESSRFTHNPFWLRSLKVSFCACSSSFGSSCRLRGAGGYGLRGALHHGKLHRRLFAGSVQRLFRHIAQGFRHAVSNVGILLCDGDPSSLIAFAML